MIFRDQSEVFHGIVTCITHLCVQIPYGAIKAVNRKAYEIYDYLFFVQTIVICA